MYQVMPVFYLQLSIVKSYLKEGDTKIHMLEYDTVICILYLCLVLKKHTQRIPRCFSPQVVLKRLSLFHPLLEFHELFIQINLK